MPQLCWLTCPPGNKRKGADIARSLFIPERAGTTLTWHLRLPHPTWEESLSHFLDSVSSAPDTQPSITCSERCWAASTQTTTLILFEQAARPTTPPALLNVDIAHEATLFSVSKANIYQLCDVNWTEWDSEQDVPEDPTRLKKFSSVKTCARWIFFLHTMESLGHCTNETEQILG